MMKLNFYKNHKTTEILHEVELIRACARLEITGAWASWIGVLLKGELDWRKVRDLANHHRVLPLVYRCLYTTFRDKVPKEAMAELRTAYQANAARNLFLTNELLMVLDLFETEGIPSIPIKGPALAKDVYDDVTYRQFDDLDVLVREGDVAAVSELLTDHGYIPVVVSVGSEARTFLKNEGECGFSSPCGRYHVDVHWQMVPRSFLDLDHAGLWERSGVVVLGGKEVRTFSPSDLLLLLSIHGMRHLWGRHAWICDLAQVLRVNPDLDWDGAFDRGQPLQVERFLNVGLILASDYYNLDLPEWVSNQILADRSAFSLVEQLRNSPNFNLPEKTSLVRLYVMNALARTRFKDKVSYLLQQVLTPSLEDWAMVRMPGYQRAFYNVLRPLRLLMEYGLKPLAEKIKPRPAPEDTEHPIQESEAVRTV